jgi:hypothetical protein
LIQSYKKEARRILSIPGVYRVRLYETDDEVSNISTAERKIHGGGPGQQRFLAFYEIADIALPAGSAWKEAMEGIEKKMKDSQKEPYWLDFVMVAPRRKER